MINPPVTFTIDELKLIQDKRHNENFSSRTWSDPDLNDLKSKIKAHYLKVQKHHCPYCQMQIRVSNHRNWDTEHIIPRTTVPYFMFEPQNLCVSCTDCNNSKKAQKVTNSKAKTNLPIKSEQYLIIHPHFDNYKDHITVIEAGLLYIAKSPKGENTIKILSLNRFHKYGSYGDPKDIVPDIILHANALADSDLSKNRQDELLRRIIADAVKHIS